MQIHAQAVLFEKEELIEQILENVGSLEADGEIASLVFRWMHVYMMRDFGEF